MSEKYPACDHRNKTLYFINTSGVIWQKEFDVEKCETFTEAKGKKKKSLTTHREAFEECRLQIITNCLRMFLFCTLSLFSKFD